MMNRGIPISEMNIEDEVEFNLFNQSAYNNGEEIRLTHQEPNDHELRRERWVYPPEFDELNIVELFLGLCDTEKQRERVIYELTCYVNCGLEKLLRWAVWFMCVVEQNNLFVGVGRGSSVSSYCLYLIGLHMVDSIEYDLNPDDFFKIQGGIGNGTQNVQGDPN